MRLRECLYIQCTSIVFILFSKYILLKLLCIHLPRELSKIENIVRINVKFLILVPLSDLSSVGRGIISMYKRHILVPYVKETYIAFSMPVYICILTHVVSELKFVADNMTFSSNTIAMHNSVNAALTHPAIYTFNERTIPG